MQKYMSARDFWTVRKVSTYSRHIKYKTIVAFVELFIWCNAAQMFEINRCLNWITTAWFRSIDVHLCSLCGHGNWGGWIFWISGRNAFKNTMHLTGRSWVNPQTSKLNLGWRKGKSSAGPSIITASEMPLSNTLTSKCYSIHQILNECGQGLNFTSAPQSLAPARKVCQHRILYLKYLKIFIFGSFCLDYLQTQNLFSRLLCPALLEIQLCFLTASEVTFESRQGRIDRTLQHNPLLC